MLPAAAGWLRQRYAPQGGMWDLSGCVLVTGGGRAARRLLEVLVDTAGEAALIPPTIITLGDLPELLYSPPPSVALASDLEMLLARAHALRTADDAVVRRIVPHPPRREDVTGWLVLAEQLHGLSQTLAADLLQVAEVAPRLAAAMPDFADEQRWAALAHLQRDYERTLADHGLIDRSAARIAAINEARCACDRDIILIATADLNRMITAMLKQVGDRVKALVHAPASEAASFDALGGLLVDAWDMRPLPIVDTMLRVVDQPRDQAYEVVRVLSEPQPSGGEASTRAADEVTVGLGDDTLGPTVERTLELVGVPARHAAGRSASVSSPVLLLRAVARFVAGGWRFDDFAALLRHPDLERLLASKLGPIDDARHHWLTLLDRYATQTLQRRLTGAWLGDETVSGPMKRLFDAVMQLLPANADRRLPLPEWSEPIGRMLATIYDQPLHRHDETEGPLVRVLQMIGDALRESAQLSPTAAIVPHVTFAQAIELLLNQVGRQPVPSESSGGAVELLGWLELQLDDAPVLIVTGFNEGAIPQSRTADMFLPDAVRRTLGLADNRRRLARDRMTLEAILRSRPHVTLISGRRSVAGDPLKPSRLLLLEEPAALAQRMERFYTPSSSAGDVHAALLSPGDRSAFVIPPPQRDAPMLDKLRVTAFRDYLACPYRFYLKHILKLAGIDDHLVELDGASFGNLAHDTLSAFGKSDEATSTDPARIAASLDDALDRLVVRRYGRQPGVAVVLQREQLRHRLRHFAHWQAAQTAAGWRIMNEYIEHDFEATLDVEGTPFTITGRIDRIDLHDQHGYRVIDYKTADTPNPPDRMHRKGPRDDKEWIDLQLPLYHLLTAAAGLTGDTRLGYVQLPKDVTRIEFDEAPWNESELAEAIALAHTIVSNIRAGVFWSPAAPPAYEDDFAAICMDACMGREEAIARVSSQLGFGEGGMQ